VADIRCPSCGRETPDFLDVCQFCQSPLTTESTLRIGQKPTKKDTGELENILPDWLKDARKQSRDLAEEDAMQAASLPKVQKDEPPDLLAGLAFQSEGGDEEQIPDWLSSIRPETQGKQATPPSSTEPGTDFFAQLNATEPSPKEDSQQDIPTSIANQSSDEPPVTAEHDELSAWLAQASEQPVELSPVDPDPLQATSDWEIDPDLSSASEHEPAPRQEEDLGWLRNLEAASKQTDNLPAPKQEADWLSGSGSSAETTQSSEHEDLSWLNNLGGTPASEQPATEPSRPPEDLRWLNDLGGVPVTEQPEQPSVQPQEDLSWLNTLSGNSEALPASPTEAAAQDDLSWLNELGGVSEPVQNSDFVQEKPVEQHPVVTPAGEASSQEDLSWLNELQGSTESVSAEPFSGLSAEQDSTGDEPADKPVVPPFTPRRTAPLGSEQDTSMPDWLKSAAEGPSMPVGAHALEQFREDFKVPSTPEEPFSWKSFVPEASQADDEPDQPQPEPASVEPFTAAPDTSGISSEDVDSLFSMDMPDWLSHPDVVSSDDPLMKETPINAEGGDALTPVDLPSWVQAMRPVEAIIPEAAADMDNQPAEREGPLAGFKGVIPAAPIGSSRRPRAVSLTLQASNEQQTSASILEQILASETSPRALVSPPSVVPQQMLRRAIAVLVWVVLGIMVSMRSQNMPVSALLPLEARDVTNLVMNISDNAPVLVILDYEPALSGEMEALSGPLLDQLVMLRHPYISFLTTSPNGTALVERLLVKTNINQAAGHGYRVGENYTNMGYLPGGESGVLTFMQSPQTAIPASPVLGFSEYAAVILLTDHADSARVWVEQLHILKQTDAALASQPLLTVSSAQAGPMLQPYAASGQISALISGLSDAVRYEFLNSSRPGIARSYWDAFGVGLMLAITLIVLGSLWNLFLGIRSRRAEAAEG
jgi:hypothetical protein